MSGRDGARGGGREYSRCYLYAFVVELAVDRGFARTSVAAAGCADADEPARRDARLEAYARRRRLGIHGECARHGAPLHDWGRGGNSHALSAQKLVRRQAGLKKLCTTLPLDATLSMGVEDGVKPPGDGAGAKMSPVRTVLIVALYLALNSSLNLLNRYTLGHAGFRYPVSLTCAHLVFQICSLAPVVFSGKPAGETHAQTMGRLWKALVAIGAFMSLNIALNNASLLHLSLSFNQVIRASIPVVCAACAVVVENKVPSPAEAAGLFLVAAGVMATIAGSADKSKQRPDETIGIVFCVVATLSNALMMTFSGRIMGPERLNALYLTFYTSPVVLALLARAAGGSGSVGRCGPASTEDVTPRRKIFRGRRYALRACV